MKFFQFLFNRSHNDNSRSSQDGVNSSSPKDVIGRIAKTLTPLKTSGYIELDGKKMEVSSVKGFIPEGSMVKIIGKQMSWFLVEPA
ncbi:MAG: NfeD family protein [Bacteroidota bacterium]